MEIRTTRFGTLQIDSERIVTFQRGLLGFPQHTRFALIQTSQENYFFWLQSVDDANLAFIITDPTVFFPEYQAPLREETVAELQVQDARSVQYFVICNKVADQLTGNLMGPLVVNAANHKAAQIVLTDKKWTTRQPLMTLGAIVPLAKSA